ncbi:MAG: hypothetical protein KGI52_07415 [Burkholderiales bacterium]|nr:hypothetical protein [Burkholderiales bacterium]
MNSPELARLIIDALGGNTVLSRRLSKCSPAAVSLWRTHGIPPARMDALRAMFPLEVQQAEAALSTAESE